MTTEIGRPRNRAIDDAVLRATVALLGESSYAELSLDVIAARAGTSKPAIYRRWRGKAHLVHEAVFPIDATMTLPDTGSLEADVREMIRRTMSVLSTPAARAALPGLVGEMASDPTLHSALLERFSDVLVRGLNDYLQVAIRRGDVRDGVTPSELAEAVAGMALLALITRGADVDDVWIDRTAKLITKGISA
ncbi:TetR/AcrR family transcriptional regulator [Mycolicibacterium sp. BiH015]|uniref:TetR/AcrR family transcriptional regulator n=1 Tax=Mycolicibacterium sp. BiH015 TaxID=3018808 RepID=UPI0022E65ACE|nr:TetR/AcrR family transcriptional regulator [Mycolicibacterium sp. BiH015]MDA2895336.1 TetR/AcrR family transcriptional regulator [Mycolicibacterium sp. BiH015]